MVTNKQRIASQIQRERENMEFYKQKKPPEGGLKSWLHWQVMNYCEIKLDELTKIWKSL